MTGAGKKQLHFGLISNRGEGIGWRHPASDPSPSKISAYIAEAQLAERGLFDLYFLADSSGLRNDPIELWSRQPYFHNTPDPIAVLSAVATHTSRIGLGGTATTSYYQPYHVARFFQTLDHISDGRSAWNAVTSANAFISLNFGQSELPDHEARYDRAREFIQAVCALWETWDADAFVYDKDSGLYFDPDKLHPVWFEGEHVQILGGGLNLERGPQGRPVIIQAGGSPSGRQLAAETAEVVFSGAKAIPESAAYNADVRRRMSDVGRNPEDIRILPSMRVLVAETRAEAEDRYQELLGLMDDRAAALKMGVDLELDVRGLPLDEPIPSELIPETANFHAQFFSQIVAKIRAENPTLRELARWYSRPDPVRGTAADIADMMEEWLDADAADGFIIGVDTPPALADFVRLVVPELQRRGVYRTEYEGPTLRENFGLPAYAPGAAAVAAPVN